MFGYAIGCRGSSLEHTLPGLQRGVDIAGLIQRSRSPGQCLDMPGLHVQYLIGGRQGGCVALVVHQRLHQGQVQCEIIRRIADGVAIGPHGLLVIAGADVKVGHAPPHALPALSARPARRPCAAVCARAVPQPGCLGKALHLLARQRSIAQQCAALVAPFGLAGNPTWCRARWPNHPPAPPGSPGEHERGCGSRSALRRAACCSRAPPVQHVQHEVVSTSPISVPWRGLSAHQGHQRLLLEGARQVVQQPG